MAWVTPQTWTSDKALTNEDFNRIEGNQEHIKNYTSTFQLFQRSFMEMDFKTINIGNEGFVDVFPGATCYDYYDVTHCAGHTGYSKKISTWSSGSGAGGLLSNVSLTANMWLYVFILGNTNNDSFDICIEDTAHGGRIQQLLPTTLSAYNVYKRIACIKIDTVYSSSTGSLYPMLSRGNRVYYGNEPIKQTCSITPADNTNVQFLTLSHYAYGYLCPWSYDFNYIVCGYFHRTAFPVSIWSSLMGSSSDFAQSKINKAGKVYAELLVNATSPAVYFKTSGGTQELSFWITGIIDDRRRAQGLT